MLWKTKKFSVIGKLLDYLFQLSRPQKTVLSIFVDIFSLCFAFWLALMIGKSQVQGDVSLASMWAITLVITLIAFIKSGLYKAVIRYTEDQFWLSVFGVTLLSSILFFLLGSFFYDIDSFLDLSIIYWVLCFLFVGGIRYAVRFYYRKVYKGNRKNVIIYGAGQAGNHLAGALRAGHKYNPVAFVDDNFALVGTIVAGIPVYSSDKIESLINRHQVSIVLLAIGNISKPQKSVILKRLEKLLVEVKTIPVIDDIISGRAQIDELRDIEIEDLLGRDPVKPDTQLLQKSIAGRNIMITGAGGSIGSELCRQIIQYGPKRLVLFEICEYALYRIQQQLEGLAQAAGVELVSLIGSVQDRKRVEQVMRCHEVDTLYHAAAYKHVPLVEHNVIEGIRNNVFGTWVTAEAAVRVGVKKFVLISTDKAVRPTNVMGASKRLAELVLQGLSTIQHNTAFTMVRFGNVLGSSGSVVPLFREQIHKGGPVTVTHPEIIRYFMTIPEACLLVLQAGAMGGDGEVFVLDMGEPVRILDLAIRMIRLMGLEVKDQDNPKGDIEIVYTGLRPGEKLYEELLVGDNPTGTAHPKIMKAHEFALEWEVLEELLQRLEVACEQYNVEKIRELLLEAPLGYKPLGAIVE